MMQAFSLKAIDEAQASSSHRTKFPRVLKTKFSCLYEARLKQGVFVEPPIRELLKDVLNYC